MLEKLLLDLTYIVLTQVEKLPKYLLISRLETILELYQETLQSKTVYGSRLRKNYRCDIFPKKERNYNDERTNGVSSSGRLLT